MQTLHVELESKCLLLNDSGADCMVMFIISFNMQCSSNANNLYFLVFL